jgi:hypothetical protein
VENKKCFVLRGVERVATGVRVASIVLRSKLAAFPLTDGAYSEDFIFTESQEHLSLRMAAIEKIEEDARQEIEVLLRKR